MAIINKLQTASLPDAVLDRRQAVPALIENPDDFLMVAGLAGTAWELSALTHESPSLFGLGGAMGAAPMIGLGLALAQPKRRVLVVHATYDLTFIRKYSLEVLENFGARGVDFVSKVLPCGHYTTGEWPYKYLDGWYLGSFVWGSFKRLREAATVK